MIFYIFIYILNIQANDELKIERDYKYEKEIPKSLIEHQRKYSGEAIYEMIKHAKTDGDRCNIRIKSYTKDLGGFSVKVKKKTFFYTNIVYDDDLRDLGRYECLLAKDRSKLECKSELVRGQMYQTWDDFTKMTMYLDDAGKITKMEGKMTREKRIFGHTFPFMIDTLAEFKCDIQDPAIIKKKSVNNLERDGEAKRRSRHDRYEKPKDKSVPR